MSHLDSTTVGTKTPDPTPLTRPTESSKRKGKLHVSEDPETDPSSLESSLSNSNLSHDSNYRKYRSKVRDKNKNYWKHTKQDSLGSSFRDSDSSNKSDYRCKRHKNKKSHQKKDPIKLCAR